MINYDEINWDELDIEEFDKVISDMLNAGKKLPEDVLSILVWEHDYFDQIEGEEHRWTRDMTTIFKFGDSEQL